MVSLRSIRKSVIKTTTDSTPGQMCCKANVKGLNSAEYSWNGNLTHSAKL